MIAPARGFTLLEILIVMVLVGIITSFALLSVGGGPREHLAEEARRLTALVELHQQEATLSGETRGIQFARTGYAILRQDEKGAWQAPAAAGTLIQHQLPPEIVLGLWVEGRLAPLKESVNRPQVLLLASGETTEFVAVFGLADERGRGPDASLYRVASDPMGRLTAGAVTR